MILSIEQIKQTVSTYFSDKPVKKVYLFGSYAKGEAKEGSDIDLSLALAKDSRVTYFTMARYVIDLEEKFKLKIDLIEDGYIYEQLQPFINENKILLFAK